MSGFGGAGVHETDRFHLTGQGDCAEFWDQEWLLELERRDREQERAMEPLCFDEGRCVGHEAHPGAGTLGLRYCDEAQAA